MRAFRRFPVLGWLLLAAAVLAPRARAVEPYTPVQPDPLLESWRWTRFEQLDQLGFNCMAEAADGSVWFGFRSRVVHFDGLREEAYDESDGLVGAPVRSILVARDGSVYALTRTRFLRLEGRRWVALAAITNRSGPGNRLRQAPDGTIWALVPDELLAYRDGTLRHVTEVPRPLSQFTIAADNTLWLAPQQGGTIWQCPVVDGGLVNRDRWTAHHVFPATTATEFSLLAAHDGGIWVVTENASLPGARFLPQEHRWVPVDLRGDGGSLSDYAITESADGTIWISGQGRLHAFRHGVLTVYTQADLHSIPFYPYAVYPAQNNTLWLCGDAGYIYRIDCSDRHWSSYVDLGFQVQAADGARWFISREHHVVVDDPARNEWRQYTTADGLMDQPVAVAVAHDGTVWAAGSDHEQAAVARLEGTRWRLDRYPGFARGIARQSVYETHAGDMLFGAEFGKPVSPGCSGGLLRYHYDGREWQVTPISPPLAPFRIITLAEGDDGSLWLGGDHLARIKHGRAVATRFPADATLPRALTVAADAAKAIWVAQWGGGVFRYAHGVWRHFTERDGLASDLVAGVATGADGSVWAASPGGLSRFDGQQWVKAPLPSHFGLDLGPSHLRIGPDNSVWIVTTADAWYDTRRGQVRATPRHSGALLRSFRYHPGAEPPDTRLQPGPAEVAQKQPVVFVWHGVDRWSETPADMLEFSHRVDGGAWSPFSREHSVMLAGLASGSHVLEVRARDRDFNLDPTPARATFVVLPPVWRQPWFIALVSLFAATVAGLVWLLVRLRIRHVMQLGELKVQFFTNISHELRTPLAVILGPLDRMIGEATEPRTRTRLETIRQNAAHMLELIDQILDFRRLQWRPLPPVREPVEVVGLLRAQHERFRAYAEDRALVLRFHASADACPALCDPDTLVKIADNLVSNAIKYTPPGGEIAIEVACEAPPPSGPARLTLRVLDSGVGIPAAEQARIFDLFYRGKAARQSPAGGVGIGLAFTHELVTRAGGEITVRSPAFPPAVPARGTCFTVTLPLEPAPRDAVAGAPLVASAPLPAPVGPGREAGQCTLLVVDDSADIRNLLRDEFADDYVILEAENGARGLALAEEHLPDCVIADVMMPELDGGALCARLKQNELTAHIPVILLTARASTESQLRGLGAGADDYVQKPVSFAVLRARVQNLIAARAKLRERFRRQVFLAPQEVAITPANEQFIQRALRTVEERLGDNEFDVEAFARALGLSRASLFRKFKAIAGQTPSDFIRDLRLERARQLLASGRYNVSQTAAAVGFLDLSHFAACFRKKFGRAPSDSAKHTVV